MSITGIVLAGGKSSRMGQDKALMSINGTTQLQRTIDILKQTSVDQVVVSTNDLAHSECDCRCIEDRDANKGPLSGIHSISQAFSKDDLLVVPVDLPLLNVDALQQLIDCGESVSRNTQFYHHTLPMFLKNTAKMRETLDYTLRCTNHYSVNRFCTHFPLLKIKLSKQSTLFNTNSPELWRSVEQHFPESGLPQLEEKSHVTFK